MTAWRKCFQVHARGQHHQPALTVSDNGPGIATDQREKVLERFVRLAPDRSTAGNGLGLSLVKAVADLHGAELQLEDNQPGLRVTLLFNLEIVV